MLKRSIRRIVAALCVVMTTSAFIFVPVSATEEPSDFGQYYGIVNASELNVRASASLDAEVVATLPAGACVKVNWMEPGWINVAYNGDGLMGYVSDEYFTVYEGEIPQYSSTGGQAAVEVVKQYLGVPYVYGGTSPSGFDCSGLMQYVYKQLGYSINRVADAQMRNGISVSRAELAPGDLVGFYSSPGSGYVSHIGMYVGDGMMIHAPHTGDVVRYASIDGSYYSSRFAGGRRIIY
ncbi:MAG: NlpC/P60 family protein [Clostridia bacterium]|nr:NlpC/P60 family protein [Clostridia bacterium]